MNRHQFIGYLKELSQLPHTSSALAQEVVEQYPYFHAAHLLLAVAYHQHHDVRAGQALRRAAAFLPNRALLYEHLSEEVVFSADISLDQPESPMVLLNTTATDVHKPLNAVSVEAEQEPKSADDKHELSTAILDEVSGADFAPSSAKETPIEATLGKVMVSSIEPSDPESEQHLKAGSNIPSPLGIDNSPSSALPSFEEEAALAVRKGQESDWLKTAAQVSSTDPVDELDKEWLSKGIETGVSLGVSNIGSDQSVHEDGAHGSKTFLEWLKAPKPTGLPVAKDDPKKKVQAAIIDRFIVQEPRISKPKAEFFTPQQAAKQSLVNDPNLASETLAGIYELQGNFGQAVKIYEALALKFPGKSRYFASLAKKAREKQQQNRSK